MTITTDIRPHGQNLRGTAIDDGHQPKLRADIRRNAYDDQSYAHIEAWSESGWHLIRSVPIEDTDICSHSYVEPGMGREGWKGTMQRDLRSLLEYGYRFFEGNMT